MSEYCKVSIVKLPPESCWRIVIEYEDGDCFLSKKTFRSRKAATAGALEWVNENVEIDGMTRQ